MSSRALAWAALVITVLIWGGYLVAARAAALTQLTPIDVGLLRSFPAAVILLPLTFKRGLFPGGANWLDIFLIGIVGGTLFTLLLNNGTHYASAADAGIFAPSMLPAFVALLTIVFLSAKFHTIQYLGLAVIIFGAGAVGGYDAVVNSESGAWRGHILYLCASFSWAIYTVRFRASGLSAIDAALILATWSSFFLLIGAAIFGSNLTTTPTPILATQLAMGIAAGLIANFTYLYAVRGLGSPIAAASAALVPVIAALGGFVFLAEDITLQKCIGIAVIAVGVVLASGLVSKPVAQN